MGDAASGLGSTVIQLYLNEVMHCYFNPDLQVRLAAVQVLVLTLSQGLVTPGTSIPTLIAMSTDSDPTIRVKASNMLKEIDGKYTAMVPSKSMPGVRLAFKLHKLLQRGTPGVPIRGLRVPSTQEQQQQAANSLLGPNDPVSLGTAAPGQGLNAVQAHLGFLYSLIRTSRQQRRSFLNGLLKFFDESSVSVYSIPVLGCSGLNAFSL